jgi:hypothetical protein
MYIQPIRYAEAAPAPASDACELRMFPPNSAEVPDCELIGDVFLASTGYSIDCGFDRVQREVRAHACRMGGDTATIRTIADRRAGCTTARGLVYRCGAEVDQP